jgi:hypothetical protein
MAREPRAQRVLLLGCGALLVAASAGLFAGCGTDAVGIEACRSIEQARCEVAPVCESSPDRLGVPEDRVDNCVLYYRDACRVGLENIEATEIDQAQIDACVASIQALGACQQAGGLAAGSCEGVELVEDADPLSAPCAVLKSPEKLRTCAFIQLVPDESTSTSSGGGAGGGGGSGGSGG